MPTFHLDGVDERSWDCVDFDEPWNGWATPVVTRDVLVDVLHALGWEIEDVFGLILATDPADPSVTEQVEPSDQTGLYRLGQLGWTFVEGESATT